MSHLGRYQNHPGNVLKIPRPSPVLLPPAWASVFVISPVGDSNTLPSLRPAGLRYLKGQWDKMMQTRDSLWSEGATPVSSQEGPEQLQGASWELVWFEENSTQDELKASFNGL